MKDIASASIIYLKMILMNFSSEICKSRFVFTYADDFIDGTCAHTGQGFVRIRAVMGRADEIEAIKEFIMWGKWF